MPSRNATTEVWILNEDQTGLAKTELEHFLAHPDDPRFGDAKTTAEAAKRNVSNASTPATSAMPARPGVHPTSSASR